MKLLVAITTLCAAAAASKYAPGQDCPTNKGCDQNCIGGKWSVVIEAGDARMVCNPSTLDSTRYAQAKCYGNGDQPWVAEKNEKTVCDNMNGKFCHNCCFFTTLASKEEDLTTRYQKACAEQKDSSGSSYKGFLHVYPTKEQAVKNCLGNCDVSIFS